MTEIRTLTANRYWGRGRLLQLATRVWCKLHGHAWLPWFYDWPYDVPDYWEEVGEPMRDPTTDEELLWARGCKRMCGCIQHANVSIRQSSVELPGQVTSLGDNPLRTGIGEV